MIIDLFRALQAGKELANAETWKKAQLWTANLTILLGAAVSIASALGYPIPLSGEQITTLVSALAVLVGVFNSYTTVATTRRIGLPAGSEADPAGVPDGSTKRPVHNDYGQWIRELDDRDIPALHDVEEMANDSRTRRR